MIIGAVVVLAVIGATAKKPVEPVASASPTAQPSATQRPTAQPTAQTPPTPTPTTDPELAYQVWLSVFPSQFDALSNDLSDAIESDFYWITSVDRLTYSPDSNTILIEATIDFESVYLNDRNEWRTDTWSLYQSWSRDIWASFVEGFGSGNDTGFVPDWPRFTPSLALNGNAKRLTVTCPGSLIYRVSQRDATQTEFLAECSFKP